MQGPTSTRLRRVATGAALAFALTGCASTANNPKDPLEGYNRAVFAFNDKVDSAVLKPTATAYKNVVPGFVQTGINNFFGNLSDVWTAANQFLQGRPAEGVNDITRVALNTTFGLGGLIDIASKSGLPKHNEDFGQTLGVWGVSSGPYLILPLLGPSTVRDTVALPLDRKADPWNYKDPVHVRNIGTAVNVIDQRAVLLDASNLLEEAALDRYEFIRDGFMQRRESKVLDGREPKEADTKGNKDASAEKASQ
jgi:phospholipid-binding lipoprotein MlaA